MKSKICVFVLLGLLSALVLFLILNMLPRIVQMFIMLILTIYNFKKLVYDNIK